MVTDLQVLTLWKEYKKSRFINIAALKSGMDRKTASKYLNQSKLPSEKVGIRDWRTCCDKLEKIWPFAQEHLELEPDLEAKSLFEHLLDTKPDLILENQLRTFQRRVKEWRIKNGQDKEVYFDQITTPGKMAQLDWLDMNKIGITVNNVHFKHKFIHFTLNHSNVESATLCKSESINSIRKGLRDFLYRVLGKAPQVLQVDNSSAATHRSVKDKPERVFNEEYLQILNYYGIKAQKNNIAKPNENGVVESQNGHLKNKIIQAIKIRGSKDFKCVEEYELFINQIVDKANKKRKLKLDEEVSNLNEIPSRPLPEYQEMYVTIRNRSIVTIKKIRYSVPSKLIGSKLKARIYESKIDLYSGVNLVYSISRVLGRTGVVINYRHLIHSLIRKPGAFESYKYKEELYPTENFKKAYDFLTESKKNTRRGTLEYLRILKLAADNVEEDVDIAIGLVLDRNEVPLNIDTIGDLILESSKKQIESIDLIPDLSIYDEIFLYKGDESNERVYH